MSDDDLSERFELHDGRILEIRPTVAADGPRLQALFRGLSREDTHRRFFSAFTPRSEWCERWAAVAERGGFGVIALVHPTPSGSTESDDDRSGDDRSGDDGSGEVIGEAGYGMRPDGDGDFAVTVAAPWRGWLGAYLLDVVVRHAAAAGIANLQAEALQENTPMITMLRHRGAVAMEHPGDTVRLSVSTTGHMASWPPNDDRPRVLVEVQGGRWIGEDAARSAGLSTVLCSGPKRRARHGCPLLTGDHCPLADGADAIVVLLDQRDEQGVDIIAAHRRNNPGTPVLIRHQVDATPEGCIELSGDIEATVDEIASLIESGTQSSVADDVVD